MKTSLFIISFILSVSVFSETSIPTSDSNNSTNITQLGLTEFQYRIKLKNATSDLKTLFINDEENLKNIFPEFKIKDLVKKMKQIEIVIVNEDLTDKDDVNRTCLNFPNLSKIKCSLKELQKISDYEQSIFILILHEYLGLLGVEETSILNPQYTLGYSISNRITPYITEPSAYDLMIDKTILNQYENSIQQKIEYININRNWFGFQYRSTYPSDKDLIRKAVDNIRLTCEAKFLKIVFITSEVFDLKHGEFECGKGRPCLESEGNVVSRYICE